MQFHSPTIRVSSTCPLHEWHISKSTAPMLHSPAKKGKRNICLQCTLQKSEKGRVVKYKDLPYLTHHTSLAKPKACPPWPTWQKQPEQHLFMLKDLTSLTDPQLSHLLRLPLSTPDNTRSCLGAQQTLHPPTYQGYYPRHQTISLDTRQSPSPLDNLFHL